MMESSGLPFGEVVRDVAAMTVFTTHTPVAAGHDRFPAPLVEEHLGKIREALHLSYDDFMGLGRVYPGDPNEPFCMTVLALKLSRLRQRRQRAARHGLAADVAAALSPTRPRRTCRSATSPTAFTCRAGSRPRCTCSSTAISGPTGPSTSGCPRPGRGSSTVEDAELWETQQVLKARLINFVRNRLASQARRRNEPDSAIERAMEALDLNALTIGFARRFATYKRAGLVLQDVERLTEMVSSADRPIQIIFGGKAHPEDRMGKELIQNIVRLTRAGPVLRTASCSSKTTT